MAKTTKKTTTTKTTVVRMSPETHARMRALALEVGVSQIRLVHTLSFATRDDYMECERRRVSDRATATDQP